MNKLHPQIKELEYNYITDGIYVGTNQCCRTHFDKRLKKQGITADISLEEKRVDVPFGVDFYVWIPIPDHAAPTQDQLDFGVTVLEKLMALKKKVYVHCQNGHGRAPTLVAAYLIKQGKNPNQAVAIITAKRPSTHLEDSQKAALIEFSQTKY